VVAVGGGGGAYPPGSELTYKFSWQRTLVAGGAPRRAAPGRVVAVNLHTDIVPSINATLNGRTSPAGCDGRPQAADSTTLRR